MDQLIPGLPDEIARECLIRVPYKHLHTVGSVSEFWQSEVESPAFHRLRKTRGLSRVVILLSQAEPSSEPPRGGPAKNYAYATPSYRLTLYEPDSGTWDALPAIPGLAHGLPHFCQIAAAGRSLVVIGGWDPETWAASDEVHVYDFVLATWHRGARLPGRRRSFFACASDSHRMVFVAGGHDDNKNALRSALAYDVAEDRWVPLPDMPRERDECRGVIRGGVFHVVGGYGTEMQGQFGKSSVAFDLATWQWAPVEEGTLNSGMYVPPKTCVVAGGDGYLYRCRAGHVEILDGDKWTTLSDLPDDVHVAPFVVPCRGKRLMVVGSPCHAGPHVGYILEIVGKKENRWTRVEVPEEYSGHVQAGDCLEI